MIKCSECGYENMDGLDYCDGCGAKLNAAASGASSGGGGAPSTPAQPASASAGASASSAQPPAEEAKPAQASEAPTGEIKPPEPAPAEPAATPTSTPAEAPAATTTPSAAAATAAYVAKLVVVRGGRKNQEFPLEEGNNLIGRWDPETGAFPEVDLDADDPEAKISRKHALLRMESGKLTIEDIGSLNGTYVNRNGARLTPGNPVDLKNGDEIIIGKTFLKLSLEPVS